VPWRKKEILLEQPLTLNVNILQEKVAMAKAEPERPRPWAHNVHG